MQTKRTISNISYNSPAHFTERVSDLIHRKVIDWCYWIVHQPDTDETKQHIHFVLQPSARLDTTDLRKFFFETDPQNPSKPLTCTMKWLYTTSLDDWLLYAVHDPYYLASKGQRRNVQYDYRDICTTDEDALRADWNAIDRMKYERLRWLYDAVKAHVPFAVLVQTGHVPIAQRSQFEYQYNALAKLEESGLAGRFLSHENIDEDGVITSPADEDGQDE